MTLNSQFNDFGCLQLTANTLFLIIIIIVVVVVATAVVISSLFIY